MPELAQRQGTMVRDPLLQYGPPFDLLSDMLLVSASVPTPPLREAFPGESFLSLDGKTPLVSWFCRIKQIYYTDVDGKRRFLGGPEACLYNELNVVALLRQRAFFVAGIYATGGLTIRIGRRYGMPKQPTAISMRVGENCFEARQQGARHSFVRARLLGSGRILAKLASLFWPWRVWPARFPSGDALRAWIQATPRVQVAWIQEGQISLGERWLPETTLLPLGLYLSDMRMQLPPCVPA